MNETLQQALAAILTKALQTAETAGAFVLGQLPDIAQQYIQYHLIVSVCLATIYALVFLVFACLMYAPINANKKGIVGIWCQNSVYSKDKKVWTELSVLTLAVSGFVLPLSFAIMVDSIKDALFYYFAPKLALIQWASSLVK